MEYPELEVGEDSFIVKELILAYKAHISTLENQLQELKNKYEPTPKANLGAEKYNPPVQKPRLVTTRQVIQELERRTSVKVGEVSDEKVSS